MRDLFPAPQAGTSHTDAAARSGEPGEQQLPDAHGPDEHAADSRAIPAATVERLATYLRVLTALVNEGTHTISSVQLAALAGVNSAKLRKDLSFLGSYGVRGVGYDVATLTAQVQRVLGLTRRRSVVLIGVGNLGQALAGYGGFDSRGFDIAALIDADPARVGTHVHGHLVEHMHSLARIVTERGISIAVVATPATVAQHVCDRIVAAGVTSILNFAPVVLSVPAHVEVRKVDLAAELQILSFHENRRDAAAVAEQGAAR